MNAVTHTEPGPLSLLEIIDLKWLLAGEGLHLHVQRLQRDTSYALRVLDTAGASKNAAVRTVAQRVRELLRLDAG